MTDAPSVCSLCGEPMPSGEEMFKIHGYSGPCPKPPLPRQQRTIAGLTPDRLNELAKWAQTRAMVEADSLAEFAEEYPDDADSIRALDNDAKVYGDIAKIIRALIEGGKP